MFDIEYKGGNCVIISTKESKVVVNPKLSKIGLKDLSVKDIIEVATEATEVINDDSAELIIDSPGEYGVADFDIVGIPAMRHIDSEADGKKSIMYRIEIGDSHIGVLGNIHYKLDEEQYEELGVLDVLIIPVGGGGYTLDAVNATSIIKNIGPKIVIPVHYSDSSLKYEVPQDNIETFISKSGLKVEETDKYRFKPSAQLDNSTIIVKINRR